jgi:hypothetical protein
MGLAKHTNKERRTRETPVFCAQGLAKHTNKGTRTRETHYHGAKIQPHSRTLSTVNWMARWLPLCSSLQGIGVLATQRSSAPPGPRLSGEDTYPVKAAAERGIALETHENSEKVQEFQKFQ